MTIEPLTIPESIISVNALLCERVLTENDGVLSAIRLVDVFFVPADSPVPPTERPVRITLVINIKVPGGSEHEIQVALARPDSEPVIVGGTKKVPAEAKFPGSPCGLALILNVGVAPTVLGLHYFVVLVDGVPVARAPFTLQIRPEAEEGE